MTNNTKLNTTCCIFNLAPHYRYPIYSLMDRDLSCDFYFGDRVETSMKLMDVAALSGYKATLENKRILFNKFWWQKDAVKLVFKKQYRNFILTGDAGILSNWIIVFFCLLLGKQSYIWMHGLNKEPTWIGKLLTYPFYGMATKFLLYGDFARDEMIKMGFPAKKMVCIYNSLDYDTQLKYRTQVKTPSVYSSHFDNTYPTIIYIGRIQKVKKVDMLIDAVSLLNNKGVNCNLVLVGENTDNISLSQTIDKLKCEEKVWVYGACYDEELISELIYNAAVCVSPGNVGLTAIHALSYGTPVITHNNYYNHGPEFEAITEGVTGSFFREDDVNDMCNKMEQWLMPDATKREQVRLAAYETIDTKYNPHYQMKVLNKLINP